MRRSRCYYCVPTEIFVRLQKMSLLGPLYKAEQVKQDLLNADGIASGNSSAHWSWKRRERLCRTMVSRSLVIAIALEHKGNGGGS
jgi:hypothetical protein